MMEGGGGDNWSCKTCKAPANRLHQHNCHPAFYRPDAVSVAQPTVPERSLKEDIARIAKIRCSGAHRGFVTLSRHGLVPTELVYDPDWKDGRRILTTSAFSQLDQYVSSTNSY